MLEPDVVQRLAFAFDGAVTRSRMGATMPSNCQKAGSARYSIACRLCLAPASFFDDEPVIGVNCRNGFVAIDPSGNVELRPHDPKYRCRHMIDADWDRWLAEAAEDPPRSSLLSKLLWGCFGEDADFEDKCRFVAETAGAAATGCITRLPRPRAVIWYGPARAKRQIRMVRRVSRACCHRMRFRRSPRTNCVIRGIWCSSRQARQFVR